MSGPGGDHHEQVRPASEARGRARRRRPAALCLMLAVTVPLAILLGVGWGFVTTFFDLADWLESSAGAGSLTATLIGYGSLLLLALIALGVLVLGMRRSIQRDAWMSIRALGVPICIGCGYNLTGLACQHSARADVRSCPECGELLPGS